MSSGSKESVLTVGINPGDIAPGIESLENGRVVDFRNQSGRYTLVNFWAAYDAESRMRNVRLMHAVNRLGTSQVDVYSISLDTKQSIFYETVKSDGLDSMAHFQAEPDKQFALRKAYKLDRGFNSYLIDDKGMIVASDVTPEKLAEVLRTI
ncbi:thioredoxin-like domain-containing protein [Parabacteroides sp. PFB2-10]|uniref:thioredoxin family protein n=1 Tax=Parabacteroides sp. PFB2-10 TaxID=1742405 RepID=UPI002473F09C|nr:thioredoxin-like domain-containing protein [Parabacteroides sp. PFB2-10]